MIVLYKLSFYLQGIITESKSGRRAILAKRVIDCTGDADVAHFAGAEYRITPKAEALGMTTILNTAGVDKKQFLEYVKQKPATYADWSGTWDQVRFHQVTPRLDDTIIVKLHISPDFCTLKSVSKECLSFSGNRQRKGR